MQHYSGKSAFDGNHFFEIAFWLMLMSLAVTFYVLALPENIKLFSFSGWGLGFDALAISLMDGRTDIPPTSIAYEGFLIDGKTYMYFGPWPSIIRMPLLYFWPELSGRFSYFSTFTACILFICSAGLLLKFFLQVLAKRSDYLAFVVLLLFCYGLLFASPLAAMVFTPKIFHEPTLWSLAFGSWALWFAVRILYKHENNFDYCLLSIFTSLTLLSRLVAAFPLCLIIGAILLIKIFSSDSGKFGLFRILSLVLPVGLTFMFLAWYNYSRFGSIFETCPMEYYLSRGIYDAVLNHSGMFNIKRVPLTLFAYLDNPFRYLQPTFPFVDKLLPPLLYDSQNLIAYAHKMLPATLVIPWMLFTALSGFLFSIIHKAKKELIFLLILSSQCFLILSFHSIQDRYLIDFMPTLILASCFNSFVLLRDTKTKKSALIPGLIFFIAINLMCVAAFLNLGPILALRT